jgi:predicted RNase H-like nuclease
VGSIRASLDRLGFPIVSVTRLPSVGHSGTIAEQEVALIMDVYVGFDSAWTDNEKAPGAICAVRIDGDQAVSWHAPDLVSFDQALVFIQEVGSLTGVTLVALDQPTIVANPTGSRPVERAAATLVSWIGGGVQPSNQGRVGMFCANAPVWPFLKSLGAIEDPEAARAAQFGLYLIEVFPAAALPSIAAESFGRMKGMKYNPQRKTFRMDDWGKVTDACAREAEAFQCGEIAAWCRKASLLPKPKKADQDRLDAVICLLVALRWRLGPRRSSVMLGDLSTGYMVLPASEEVRIKLEAAGQRLQFPVDGCIPG